MICSKCGSQNIKIEVIQTSSKTNNVSILRRIGRLTLIVCTLGLWALVPKRKEHTTYKNEKMCICQECGNSWKMGV